MNGDDDKPRRLFSETTVMEFAQWSYEQTLNPTEPGQ